MSVKMIIEITNLQYFTYDIDIWKSWRFSSWEGSSNLRLMTCTNKVLNLSMWDAIDGIKQEL